MTDRVRFRETPAVTTTSLFDATWALSDDWTPDDVVVGVLLHWIRSGRVRTREGNTLVLVAAEAQGHDSYD